MEKTNRNYIREQLQITLSSSKFKLEGETGKIKLQKSGDRSFLNNRDKSVLVQVKFNDESGKYEFVTLEQ